MMEIYSSEITDPSLRELEEFSLWYNEKIGFNPVIVGGWAVYCYTKGLGSKDIDVVFPGDAAKHVTLGAYFLSHGYTERSRSFFDKEFVKIVKNKESEIEIIIDAVTSRRTIIFDNRKARLPWSWAVKHSISHKLGNAQIYIPEIELLMVYKLGAVLGRSINLKTGIDFDYYRSKLWKDVYDVVSLSQLKIDASRICRFLKESRLGESKDELMDIFNDNFDDEIKGLLKENSLEKINSILSECK